MSIFWQLVLSDLTAFKKIAWSDAFDLMIWVIVVSVINVYLLPLFGVPTEYILISFSGTLASSTSFRVFPEIYYLLNDFHGERQISQKLILPIHPAGVFGARMLASCVSSLWASIWAIPVAIFIIRNLVPGFMFNIGYFVLAWLVSSMFFNVFAWWVASFVKDMQQISRVFIRFIFPLWFFGGFQFTWLKLHEISPIFAYLDLLNPYIYVMESMRTAMLGQAGNLDFKLCLLALVGMGIFAFTHAYRRLKKQLDFV